MGDRFILVGGKKRSTSQIKGEVAVNILRGLFPQEWVIREYTPDYGIDLSIELFEKYEDNYITTGEHIYFQVKGTEKLKIGKYKVYQRKNVEKQYIQSSLYKEIDVVKFSIETSLLATVERMGSAVPVLLTVVDIVNKDAYYICLNDYIEKVILPANPNYTEQDEITINIPIKNVIKGIEDIIPIKWYAKRAKLFAFFSKVNYQNSELRYMQDENLKEDIVHFAKIIRRFDVWSAAEYFYALNCVKEELDYFIQNGITKTGEKALESLKERGQDIDEECWETSFSCKDMSLREAQNALELRSLWDKMCNCGFLLEDLAKEWLMPTYMGLITDDE